MSGKGTAVGAAVAVGEGDGVGEGDASCACATDAKHDNSRLTTGNAARRANIIILFAEAREQIGMVENNPMCRSVCNQQWNGKHRGSGLIGKSLGIQLLFR